MHRMLRIGLTLGVAVFAVSLAGDVFAQSTADAKRTLKGQKLFYKVPGLIEVDVRSMRTTLMLTGYTPTEEKKAEAEKLAAEIRGVKEVRNRIRVREPDVAAGAVSDTDLIAKIDKKIEQDEDLAKAKAREKFEFTVTDGNVVVKGKLGDWSEAGSLISSIRNIPGIRTIDFDKLKY